MVKCQKLPVFHQRLIAPVLNVIAIVPLLTIVLFYRLPEEIAA